MPRKPTVLVVEDHPDSRDMVCTFLMLRGCEVIEATDGAGGVDIAKTALPDLILLDLNLPTIDGWQVALLLKSHHSTRDIPVIAFSANCHDRRIREKALAAGCDDCIPKPVDFTRLGKVIEPFLFRFDAPLR